MSWNLLDSGETIRAKWGERLKPASWRNIELDEGLNVVAATMRNTARYAKAMEVKSNQDAGSAIDKIIRTDVVMNNLTAEDLGAQVNQAASSSENDSGASSILDVSVAQEAVKRSLGGAQ